MYTLKVKYWSIDYREMNPEEAKRFFYKSKKLMMENHTCIEEMKLINEQGEIIDEYKR